jgi:hypothetical protein
MASRSLGTRAHAADRGDVPAPGAVLVAVPGGSVADVLGAVTGIEFKSRHRWRQPVRRHVAGQVCLQLRTARRAPQPGAEIRELAGRAGLRALDWPAIILRQ